MSAPEAVRVWQVQGHPTDTELAAAVAVLSAAVAAAAPVDGSPAAAAGTTGWSAYWRAMRPPLPPGQDAWRASGQPLR